MNRRYKAHAYIFIWQLPVHVQASLGEICLDLCKSVEDASICFLGFTFASLMTVNRVGVSVFFFISDHLLVLWQVFAVLVSAGSYVLSITKH